MALLDKVNMLITPNAFKAGKGYVVIGASDLSVLRNTTATRVNSTGLIELVGSNIMRIDYTSGTPVILDESQSTNVIPFSNTFTDVFWQGTNTNFTAAIAPTSPSSTNPAYRLTSTTSSIYSRALGGFILGSSITNIATRVYLRSDVPFTASLRRRVGGSQVALLNINVTTSWQPFTILTTTLGTNQEINIFLNENGVSGTSVVGRTLDIFNVQMENGTVNTSNIFTDAAAVTRNDDLITVIPPIGTVRITTTFLDNTTQIINTIPALFTLPTGQIRQVMFQNSL